MARRRQAIRKARAPPKRSAYIVTPNRQPGEPAGQEMLTIHDAK